MIKKRLKLVAQRLGRTKRGNAGPAVPLLAGDSMAMRTAEHHFVHGRSSRAFLSNRQEHNAYLVIASQHFGIDEIYMDMESLQQNYNLSPYFELKKKYMQGDATPAEIKEYELLRDSFTVIATKIVKAGDAKSKQIKAIGVAHITPRIAQIAWQYDVIFLIGTGPVESLFQVDSMDFFDRDDISPDEMVQYLMNYMEARNISDLHLHALNDYRYSITGRINKKLVQLRPKGLEYVVAESITNAMLQEAQRDPIQAEKEVRGLIKANLNNGKARNFRLHKVEASTGNLGSPSISLRRLASADEIQDLKNLNYLPVAVKMLQLVAKMHKSGAVIFSGPVNSGKTTTLYAWLRYVHEELKRRVFTIEAPMEIPIEGFVQLDVLMRRNANEKLQVSMEDAISMSKSHDPDLVLISEIRTRNEIRYGAVDLPKDGHLVGTTIHANDNKAAIEKIIAAGGIQKEELNDKIRLMANLKLVSRKCVACNSTGMIEKNGIKHVCDACSGSGASGMLPVYDIIAFHGLTAHDDILDFDGLIKQKKAFRVTPEDVIRHYVNMGLMAEADLHDEETKDIIDFYKLADFCENPAYIPGESDGGEEEDAKFDFSADISRGMAQNEMEDAAEAWAEHHGVSSDETELDGDMDDIAQADVDIEMHEEPA